MRRLDGIRSLVVNDHKVAGKFYLYRRRRMTGLASAMAIAAALVGACVTHKPPVPPLPALATVACVATSIVTGRPVMGATCAMDGQTAVTNADGYGPINGVRITAPDQAWKLTVVRDGFNVYSGLYAVPGNEAVPVTLTPTPPAIPPAPSRSDALAVHLHLQGLTCHPDQFGDLHWWDAALAWLNASDRQLVYACKRAAGDTHAIIELPNGRPLYDECCNDYSPDRFGPLDWSAGETGFDGRLADLVVEVRQAGLIPIVFPDERQDHSLKDIRLALTALQHSGAYGDLSQQIGLYMTGWDGVFYGWDKAAISDWAAQVREVCPFCRLGLEFNTGHIPQEAGIDMSGYDALFIEFERSVHTCNNWQIVPRLIGEAAYHRPPDDDWRLCGTGGPPVPRMPMQTPRGEIQTVCFEWKTYWWVRGFDLAAEVDDDRRYLLAEGCPAIG